MFVYNRVEHVFLSFRSIEFVKLNQLVCLVEETLCLGGLAGRSGARREFMACVSPVPKD